MKGRKPDPKAARRGTSHHGVVKRETPAPAPYSGAIVPQDALRIPPPRQLPRTKAVKELWAAILQEVARHELRVGDLPLIEALCVAKYRHAEAGAYIRKHGAVIFEEVPAKFDEYGNLVTPATTIGPLKNPMLKEERDQAVLYDRLAQRLGLSPESRIRMDLMQVAGASLLVSLRKELDEVVAKTVDG